MNDINKKIWGRVLVVVTSNPIGFVESPEMENIREEYPGFSIEVIMEGQLSDYLKED